MNISGTPSDGAASGTQSNPGDGAAILAAAGAFAQGVAVFTGLQADQAGALEATAATSADQIAQGAGAIKAVAYEQALRAAQTALHIALEIVEALQPEPGDAPLTTKQALHFVAAAQEASAQQTIAARAGAAYATAAAASELVNRSAHSAARLEHDLLANTIAAEDLATAVTAQQPLLPRPLPALSAGTPTPAGTDLQVTADPDDSGT